MAVTNDVHVAVLDFARINKQQGALYKLLDAGQSFGGSCYGNWPQADDFRGPNVNKEYDAKGGIKTNSTKLRVILPVGRSKMAAGSH